MAFAGLSIGLSSLLAQRRALDVTGQNLANVSTDGYSRQRVEMSSNSGPIIPALFSTYNGTGMGVDSGSITRLRDQFLDLRGYQEHASMTQANQVQVALDRVESAFGEPSDTGLAAQLADFWAGWDDVANRPGDLAARSQLLERASTLTTAMGRVGSTLESLAGSSTEQLEATVAEVNAAAARIADLNSTIQSAINADLNANDLMDQRDALIGQLADRVGVTIRNGEAGAVDVYVAGTALVRGTKAETLEVRRPTPDSVTVNWSKDGLPAAVAGTTGGMLATINDIVPRYRDGLQGIAEQLRDETNALHGPPAAFDLDGNVGEPFFVFVDGEIQVNPAVAGQPRKVAAAAAPGVQDGSVARKLATSQLTDSSYRQLVVSLGVEAQSANTRVEIQSAITQQVDAARDAQSGVNLDEEMTNLIAYQTAYDAAARFIQAVDEMLNVLVNLGR